MCGATLRRGAVHGFVATSGLLIARRGDLTKRLSVAVGQHPQEPAGHQRPGRRRTLIAANPHQAGTVRLARVVSAKPMASAQTSGTPQR
jgi:hypothetical protein